MSIAQCLFMSSSAETLNSLLLHFNGTNGSTTFADQTGKTVTPFGNAQISTAQSPFSGESSGKFDGTADYLTVPNSSAWGFGSGPFTIEGFFYRTGANGTNYQGLVVCDNIGGTRGWLLYLNNSGSGTLNAPAFAIFSGGTYYSVAHNVALPLNTWTHIAVTRDASTLRLFVGGTLVASTAVPSAFIAALSDQPLNIGSLWAVSNYQALTEFWGYMKELRIRREAVYTASFTPPTADLPDV